MTEPLETPDVLKPAESKTAIAYLKQYYGIDTKTDPYTGASFETIGEAGNDPYSITPADIVSLATLSVPVGGWEAIRLLAENFQTDSRALLKQIPVEAAIDGDDAATHLAEEGVSPAAQLWTLISRIKGLGRVSTSKLLARKRPALIPVYDSVINAQLKLGGKTGDMWTRYREWVNKPVDGEVTLIEHARSLHAESTLPEYVTPLRVIDVVLWMNGKHEGQVAREEDQRDHQEQSADSQATT